MVSAAWRGYCSLLHSRPLPTKMATSGIVYCASANIHQHYAPPPEGTAVQRIVGTAALGSFFHAPFTHWWFGVIERAWPGAAPVRVLTKVAVDMTIGLALSQPIFLFGRNTIEGLPPRDAAARAVEVFPTSMCAAWTILPWVYLVNFSIVPLHQRPLVGSLCGLVWTTWLLFINESAGRGEKDPSR